MYQETFVTLTSFMCNGPRRKLTEGQLGLCRDIRRRGKNKVDIHINTCKLHVGRPHEKLLGTLLKKVDRTRFLFLAAQFPLILNLNVHLTINVLCV